MTQEEAWSSEAHRAGSRQLQHAVTVASITNTGAVGERPRMSSENNRSSETKTQRREEP